MRVRIKFFFHPSVVFFENRIYSKQKNLCYILEHDQKTCLDQMPALIKFVERIMVESISFKTLSRFSFFIFHYFKHIYIYENQSSLTAASPFG